MSERPVWGYDLDGVPIEGPERFGEVLRDPRRVLGLTEVTTPSGQVVTVSTVHLVIDHNWHDDGPPVLWETMTYAAHDGGRDWGELQWRYTSAADALAGHGSLVAALRIGARLDGLPLNDPRKR